jgi:dihydrofolate synthase/folylpolyglutamate synthase
MNTPVKGYREALSYLYSLQKYGIKFGLSNTTNLLRALGDPHKGSKYIHVAGTNGKGSVCAMAASVLKESGYKVGFYSSPHLVRFTERIRVDGREIPPKEVVSLLGELRAAMPPGDPPTFFEAATVMAILHFARQGTDIALMEVGMGGRLDATNVIEPLVAVITNISLEHREFLGRRLADIAGEKAGIIKEGGDVVTAVTQPQVVGVLEEVCRRRRARLWRVGREVRYRGDARGLHYFGLKRRLPDLDLSLAGRYQDRNAATALAALEVLEPKGFRLGEESIRAGLKKAEWAGRMHVVSNDPLVILDGAHNPGAVRVLARAVRAGYAYRRLILVIGVMADKEIARILGEIVPVADYVFYTRPAYPRAADPGVLAARGAAMGTPFEVVAALPAALEAARRMAGPGDLVLVCGSLFTVGEALSYFDPAHYAPDAL